MQPGLNRRIGTLVCMTTLGETVRAYVPRPLPPEPPLDLSRLMGRIANAEQAQGRLDGVTSILPSTNLFVYMYVRKEAVLSSQIEGTQSSLSDLLIFENQETPFVPLDDVEEVSNYVVAMNHGLKKLREGFPLSLRLMRERLLSNGRGQNKQPGEFRISQNWIGGTRPGNALFVPPPPDRVMECLGELEVFLHDQRYPALVRAGLAHVQFETIHPFLDGNGRLGRLLVTLMLCEAGTLREPILYLSLFLKSNRSKYYNLLQSVRDTGDWEAWMEFFLDGVVETSAQGVETARRLMTLFNDDRAKIATLGRPAASALRVHGEMQRSPIQFVPQLAKKLSLSQHTIQKSIDHLIALGIIGEITGKKRSRLYEYEKYLNILNEGTEPLPR